MTRELLLGSGLALGGAGYLALAWFVWRHRAGAGGSALFGVLLAIFVWTACYAIELSTHTVAAAEVWSGLKFLGVVVVPGALLLFSREYALRRPARRRLVLLLAIEPLLVLVLLALWWAARSFRRVAA